MEDNDTIACPYCNEQIYEDALQCPWCENYLSDEDNPLADPIGNDSDENDTIACPYCTEQIYEGALQCPYCENFLSEEDSSPTHPTWIYLTVLLCLVVVFLWIFSVR